MDTRIGDVFLHPTTEEDFEDYYMVRSDSSDVFWNGYDSAPEKESFKNLFMGKTAHSRFEEAEDRRNYLVKKKDSEKTIGFVQLTRKENSIEIACSILSEYQGRGLGTQALRLAVKLALQYEEEIFVSIRDDNIPSQKIAQKVGFCRTESYTERQYPMVGKVKLRKYVLMD